MIHWKKEMKEEESEQVFSSHTLSGTGQSQHMLHRGSKSTESWTMSEMAEHGMANTNIPEGGSSEPIWRWERTGEAEKHWEIHRGLKHRSMYWCSGKRSFRPHGEGFSDHSNELDTMLCDGEDTQLFSVTRVVKWLFFLAGWHLTTNYASNK